MLKLIAKRFSVVGNKETPDFSEASEIGTAEMDMFPLRAERVPLVWKPEVLVSRAEQIQFLTLLEDQIPQGEVKHDFPRKIAAYALNEKSQVFAAAAHSGWINKTLHAEVCLIQDLHRSGLEALPARCTLILSMKPCAMCAGMIHDFLPKEFSGEILFLKEDPGPMARNTALDKNLRLAMLSSNSRY
jgi:cytidine deaminase